MTETLRKSLSALADQEATEFETRKIVDAIKTRGDLKEFWASCQAITSSMRGEPVIGMVLLDRINAELDDLSQSKKPRREQKVECDMQDNSMPLKDSLPDGLGALIGQFSVAASIAFAVVIGVKVVAPGDIPSSVASGAPPEIIKFQLPVQRETVSVGGIAGEQDDVIRRPVTRILTERDKIQLVSNRLSPYLVRHAENTAVVGGISVLPLARIMGRDEPIE